MSQVSSISRQIWDMKYRLKDADGTPLDETIAHTWRRVARALAQGETQGERTRWEEVFFEALRDFKTLPAGRIMAGAGTDRRVTLFNCFVMGTIPDTMSGIFESLKEAALTMQQGGGIGYDFSTLRPKGAPVRGVGADASGPLSFMDVWDAMCRTIMSAGSRRGAMMATLRCDHPDIEDFIKAKRDGDRLRMFNLSVLVTDAFMEAVRANADWPLMFDGEVYRTVKAAELWDQIMRSTHAFAEPGVIFIDRINRLNNLAYCETISATNPCVTGETWVMTDQGPRQVCDLIGRSFTALVDGKSHAATPQGFFLTGEKSVLNLKTKEGHALRLTADHPVRRVVHKTRYKMETEWTKAGALQPGDTVALHDHGREIEWGGDLSQEEGYLLGLLLGDGVLKTDKAILSVWPGRCVVNGTVERPGVLGIMSRAEAAAMTLPHRSDFKGWIDVPGRGEKRLALGALKKLALEMGMSPGQKAVTPIMERGSSAFSKGFLCGLFDADGSVQGNQNKGVSVRLAQNDMNTLQAVQRMLLRLGVASTIYPDRRPEGPRLLPDSKRNLALYDCAANHELVISGESLETFATRIGFADTDKAALLKSRLGDYKRRLNKERFTARVASLTPEGVEPVYDVQVPGVNAFDANGLYVHNCGEQPLPPYGTCLLGSLNLARLVNRPFEEGAAIDAAALGQLTRTLVRMLDNVIDISKYPLPEQRNEALSKRRIGLGITGLADALIMCGARYGSTEAVALTEQWMALIQRHAYLASADLAREKGAFPLYDADKYLSGEHIRDLPEDVRAAIAAYGVRNALLTSIAPTGTISLFADNVSSGLEPVFSFTYTRKVLQPDGARTEEEVTDYAFRLFRALKGEQAPLPPAFVSAQNLTPRDHLVMQAAIQRYIDSSISKTINVPEDIPFAEFKDIYAKAYELGCKGCTTYRPNEVTGSVLEIKPERESRPKATVDDGGIFRLTEPLSRPEVLPGNTYKLRWPESDHAMYITINDVEDRPGHRRPFEVFINSKNMEHYAWTLALTRMISAVFRRGGDVSFVFDELKAVFDPRGGHWMGGRYVPSLLAAIGEVIEQHMREIGFIATQDDGLSKSGRKVVNLGASGRLCPKCNQPALIKMEGCDTCHSCGYSKCG